MTQESTSLGLLTSSMIYSLRKPGYKPRQRLAKRHRTFVRVSPALLPPSFLSGREVTGLASGSHTAPGFLDSCEEGLHQPSQPGPRGELLYARPRANSSRNLHLTEAQSQLGKCVLLQRSNSDDLSPASGFFLLSLSHTLHVIARFLKKTNQEGNGVWDLAQTILEVSRSCQKLLPPRGLYFLLFQPPSSEAFLDAYCANEHSTGASMHPTGHVMRAGPGVTFHSQLACLRYLSVSVCIDQPRCFYRQHNMP